MGLNALLMHAHDVANTKARSPCPSPLLTPAVSEAELAASNKLQKLEAERKEEELKALRLQNERLEIELAERRQRLEQATDPVDSMEIGGGDQEVGWSFRAFLGM